MLTLTNILKINAISSGTTGLVLVIFSKFSANLFATTTQLPFIITGLFLLIFSMFVVYQAYQNPLNVKKIVSIIWMDRLWVLTSVVAVPILYNSISSTGVVIIMAIAVWVGLMAYIQNARLIRM
ncbi:hypothetical protein F8C76_02300 [Flagellimonas olearia]|uniref:Integral membrane protein n=1 Tax=Flagellimonas olearia TaxID=552546 RepID=A0A6I1E339_9FLAO|nr:hypothetical protein [Allomuricauda olearia]KAB7530361.1 hypothetical protein F8C76_02300 [Allomuricauda olearia]